MPLRLVLSLLVVLSLYSAEAAACLIKAQAASIENLVVALPGEDAFKLRLHGVPMKIRPGKNGVAKITVLAPLVFSSEHSLASLGLRTNKPSSVMGERLVAAKGQKLNLRANAVSQVGKSLPVTLPLREFVPERAINVPCVDLSVGNNASASVIPALVLPKSNISYIDSVARLPLYAKPAKGTPLWMQFLAPLEVMELRKGWLRVQATWSDGSSLRGWLPANAAKVEQGHAQMAGEQLIGSIGGSSCGRSHAPARVVFQLRAGAAIRNRPKGVIWAHSASRIKVEALALHRSDGWLQIANIDGIPAPPCSEHRKIWVHASDLVWSAEASALEEVENN